MERLDEELKRGMFASRIAFVSFTRAACCEASERASDRLGLKGRGLPWFRTIHSAAFKLLGLCRQNIMADGEWAEFARLHGYRLTDCGGVGDERAGGIVELPRRTRDDDLRFVHQWGGSRRLDPERALSQCHVVVSAAAYRAFVRRVGEFKRAEGLIDFNDMLNRVLERRLRPEVDVAFIDEAQDLSPLQIVVVEYWFRLCRRVYVAGDDDQAIYTFQGAEPGWLMSLAEQCPKTMLDRSYRIPRRVLAVAQRIIDRNRNRVPKVYVSRDEEGDARVLSLGDALGLVEGVAETLVLARNRRLLKPVATALLARGLPFVMERRGGGWPLGLSSPIAAVCAAYRVWRGEEITAEELCDLLAFVPSRGAALLPHGVKAQVGWLTGCLTESDLEGFGLGPLVQAIRTLGPTSVLLKLRPDDRTYFQTLLNRHGEIPEPHIRLTTIHSAKGREAEIVVVIPDMAPSSHAEYMNGRSGGYEAENRLAYVAVTRARRLLIVLRPSTRRYYDYPVELRALETQGA